MMRWLAAVVAVGLVLGARVAVAQETGTLRIEADPEGAEVFVDGVRVGTAPIAVPVPAGRHTVRVTHPERLAVEGTVVIRAGAETEQSVVLRRAARLILDVRPEGAEILLDGESLGHAPLPPVEVESGTHEIVVQHPTHERGRRVVQVRSGEERTITVALLAAALAPGETVRMVETKPDPWYGPWAGVALASGVVLGAVGGTLVAVDEPEAGWALVGVGGAALVTGIVFVATARDPGNLSTVLGPAVLREGAGGVVVAGEF